jgi:hypothetical protein
MFGRLNEHAQGVLDNLAATLGALKHCDALVPEKRTDLLIVMPTPNIGIKFRNIMTPTPMLEVCFLLHRHCIRQDAALFRLSV